MRGSAHERRARRSPTTPAASRFELAIGGQLAELIYRLRADRLVLVHTGVPEALEDHGIGGQLVRAAVDRAAAEGLTVVPLCPFARDWLHATRTSPPRSPIDWGNSPVA